MMGIITILYLFIDNWDYRELICPVNHQVYCLTSQFLTLENPLYGQLFDTNTDNSLLLNQLVLIVPNSLVLWELVPAGG
jgi:hypothetical protein